MKLQFSLIQRFAVVPILLLFACHPSVNLVSSNRGNYLMDSQQPVDSSIIRLYLPYKQKVDETMNAVIGHSAQELNKNGDTPETLLGNFFADAVFTEARRLDADIDCALPSTNGGLRNPIPKGNIQLSNVFELMPFENELLVLTLNGAAMEQMLTFIAESGGQPIAGLRMHIKEGKAVDVFIQGKPFDKGKTYRVLTSDYLASGGDNTLGFKNPVEKKPLNLKVRDALIQYIKGQTAIGNDINAKLDERISKL